MPTKLKGVEPHTENFIKLYPDLQADEKNFKEYMRISQEMFQYSEKRLDQHLVH